MSFNDQIKTIKRDNYNTPPTNLPLWSNPFLNLSTNEAYNALLTKGGVGAETSTQSLTFNNLPQLSGHANQHTVIDDDENLATHVMSEVYLDPGDRRDMEGFTRLSSYGTPETVVYKGKKSIVIGLRGSTMDHLGWDYVTDAEIIAKGEGIPFFTGSMEDRFREANNTYRKIRRRYPNRHIIIGGHSLGNAITLDVLKQNPNDGNLSAYGFNGLAHPDYNQDDRFHHVRKEGDLVSYLGGQFKGTEIMKSSGVSRGKLVAATVGLAAAGGLGKLALLNRGVRATLAAKQTAARESAQFWEYYGNYITNMRPNLSPTEAVAQDSVFAKEIAKYAPGNPITDITDQVAAEGVGTGEEMIPWLAEPPIALSPGFAPARLFTDEPEIAGEIIKKYRYLPYKYQSEILSGQGTGEITTSEGVTGKVFSSNQFVENPAMLENMTADSVSAAEAAMGEEAATASLATVLGTGAATILGPAALGVMGLYWLWSHSTSRFPPTKSLFIKKPDPIPGAPTADELVAAKARYDRRIGDLKPIGIGAGLALGGAAAEAGYAAIGTAEAASEAAAAASQALVYEIPSIERTGLLRDWAARFMAEINTKVYLSDSTRLMRIVDELKPFKLSGIRGINDLMAAGLNAGDIRFLENTGVRIVIPV
tara:strand:+ start:686 stop:2632 length:1947 start_codon:yes stop_codon:yes gene_type:complete